MKAERILESEQVLIVGAGLAGLFAALKMSPRPVTVLSPEPVGSGASTAWAQAGIAAAVGQGDTPQLHAADTQAVGSGLVDAELARSVAEEAPARLEDLARLGARFDRDEEDKFVLSREAGHRMPRVAGMQSDGTGREIMKALVSAVRRTESVRIVEGLTAVELAIEDGRASGVFAVPSEETGTEPKLVRADFTVLATGGLCGLYSVTTVPSRIRGHALGMAARAGTVLADTEFVQFHPTAIAARKDPAPLASEALRGAGAILVDHAGLRFMEGCHPDAELAPRDIVAREIFKILEAGGMAFLDARSIFGQHTDTFPNVAKYCRASGIDPARELIPVAPAAHFHIGGVRSDARGRTSLAGLYVCGEAAATGLHGANRLGSNSLLEATVFASRIAEELSGMDGPSRSRHIDLSPDEPEAMQPNRHDVVKAIVELRNIMTDFVGVIRDGVGLGQAIQAIGRLEQTFGGSRSFRNLTTAATLVAVAAYRRRESRGAHFRSDFPAPVHPSPCRREITFNEALQTRDQLKEQTE